jgi:hypothetical protein
MAVAVDVTGTQADSGVNVTSFNYTGITVGSGSNRALVFLLYINGGGTAPASVTATWDSGGTNQAMTLITSKANANAVDIVYVFGLRAPTSGNKTLAVSWTNAATYAADAISFTGVDQTSDATAFPNPNTAQAVSTTPSVVITSAVNNIPVAIAGTGNAFTVPNQTTIFHDGLSAGDALGQRAAGAASVTFSCTNGNASWAYAGCDVAQVAAGGVITLGGTAKFYAPKLTPKFRFTPALAFPATVPPSSKPFLGTPQLFSPGLGRRFKPQLAFPRVLSISAAQGTYAVTGQAQTFLNELANFAGLSAPKLFSPGLRKGFNPSLAFPAGNQVLTLSAIQGSYTITGNAQALFNGLASFVEYGAPELFSPGLGRRFGPSLAFPAVAAANFLTISAAQGTYILTGEPQILNASRSISAAQGTYILTGEPQILNASRSISAAQGTYILTGEPQILNASRSISAVRGTYVVTGQAQNLLLGRLVSAVQGSYTLNGISVQFAVALSIQPVTGLYSLNGQGATLALTPVGGQTGFLGYGPQVGLSGGPQAPGGGSPQVPALSR